MKKTAIILSVGLLVLVTVAVAFAAGATGLLNTKWTGVLTIVTGPTGDGNVTTLTCDNATLTFTGQDGEFLAGTLENKCLAKAFKLDFTGIKDGRSLYLTAKDYLMSAEIFMGRPIKKGGRPHQNMMIRGSNVGDGTMFEGNLIKN